MRILLAVLLLGVALGATGCLQGPQPNYVGGCSYSLNTRSHVTLYVYSTNDDRTANAALIKLAQLCKAVEGVVK